MAAIKGIIMGVDPSLRSTGIAVIDTRQTPWRLVESMTIRLPDELSLSAYLSSIALAVRLTIRRTHPTHVAIESAIWVQNHATALLMAKIEGACHTTMALMGYNPATYPPRLIKKEVSGSAAASKSTIASAVAHMLQLEAPLQYDESDAAAVAICQATYWKD
jgi:crossover junction endodeoxyribonuclease RuvC